MKKAALVAFNGDIICFVHVLANALDMKEKGYSVKVIIEGSATMAAAELGKGAHNFSSLYKEVLEAGLIDCACLACAIKMGVKDELEGQGLKLRGEMKGHPSLASYLDEGFEVITF